ncbi:MAG TPA: DMT family transporter [Casimicrobiaceae bacterium]
MNPGILCALAAAALFGASTPLAKTLVGDIPPILLAGLLYAGSGVGLTIVLLARLVVTRASAPFAWPVRGEWGSLLASIFFGGVLGPVLLMFGLAQLAASTASLLLNLETAFTALVAWFLFRENFDRRIVLGMAAILAGAVLLSLAPGNIEGSSRGALLVAAACLCWALDNNLTRKVSASDALFIAGLKGVVAGAVNLSLATGLGYALPTGPLIAQAAAVGFLGYGLSLALFVIALRQLGAARTGAYFAIAPFFGAMLAILMGGDTITLQLCVAAALMAIGVWLHVTEVHEHEHLHDAVDHIHAHRHDDHHRHAHDFEWDGTEPHTHRHRHEAFAHRHAHFPDVHHRHRHR